MTREMIAVIASVIQNAFQTPTAPKNLLSKNAAGMMTTTYRQREISKEGVPFPSPSNAPEEVTETAETINPAPMMRNSPGRIAEIHNGQLRRRYNLPFRLVFRLVPKHGLRPFGQVDAVSHHITELIRPQRL